MHDIEEDVAPCRPPLVFFSRASASSLFASEDSLAGSSRMLLTNEGIVPGSGEFGNGEAFWIPGAPKDESARTDSRRSAVFDEGPIVLELGHGDLVQFDEQTAFCHKRTPIQRIRGMVFREVILQVQVRWQLRFIALREPYRGV